MILQAPLTKAELQLEVETLRKANEELTTVLTHVLHNGALCFSIRHDELTTPESREAAEKALAAAAAQRLLQSLKDRRLLYKQNSILRSYAMHHINDPSVQFAMQQDMYPEVPG